MLELISTILINSGTCILGKSKMGLLGCKIIVILGLVFGEFLHRLSLYIEELYHVEEKQYQTSSTISPLSFNNFLSKNKNVYLIRKHIIIL